MRFAVSHVLCLFLAAFVYAQDGQISGLILDPSGSAIPNAAVTIINQQTGARRIVKSSAEGVYSVFSLTPGIYKIRVDKSGFKTVVKENVLLEASKNGRLDFNLGLAAVFETVLTKDDSIANSSPTSAVLDKLGLSSVTGIEGSTISRNLLKNV